MANFKIPVLSDIFGKPKALPSVGAGKGDEKSIYESAKISGEITDNNLDLSTDLYSLKPENWFTSKPYGFTFHPRNEPNTETYTMFLPIGPSNINISTNFATNAITTLYGTVEEHSPVRYYDISIEGTTGMAPRYTWVGQITPYVGRQGSEIVQSLSGKAGGFFSKTLAIVDKIRNTASSLAGNNDETTSGVDQYKTGYAAFHNLYRFLLKYKRDASGLDSKVSSEEHPLTFFNYKDNNEYDVIIRNFTLRRSAENPMLYYYSITMRGYNMRSANERRYYVDETKELAAKLGLNGVEGSTFLGKLKGTAKKIKGILGPLGAGINVLGK